MIFKSHPASDILRNFTQGVAFCKSFVGLISRYVGTLSLLQNWDDKTM